MPDRFATISTLLAARPASAPVPNGHGEIHTRRAQRIDTGADGSQDDASVGVDTDSRTAAAVTVAPLSGGAAARARAPRRAPEEPRTRASETADGGTRRIAFRLDPDLHHQLNQRATQTGASKGNVVLDAIEDAHAAGALTHAAPQPPHTGLFARTPNRGPATPTVLVEIRLTAQALHTVDQLVERSGQPTRTRLLHAALAHHFSNQTSGVDAALDTGRTTR